MREKLEIPPGDFVIISTGSCIDIKNHADIIKAMSLIIKEFPCTYLHLGSGHLEEQEKKQAEDQHISEAIRFVGNKKNVRDYLIAADVYVMTSKFEGLSIASIEAMACGLPSVLYNSPGLVDLIKNDDNGFLIERNPESIADKIIAYKHNPGLMTEKGNNARRFVTANFSMPSSVEKISALYKK